MYLWFNWQKKNESRWWNWIRNILFIVSTNKFFVTNSTNCCPSIFLGEVTLWNRKVEDSEHESTLPSWLLENFPKPRYRDPEPRRRHHHGHHHGHHGHHHGYHHGMIMDIIMDIMDMDVQDPYQHLCAEQNHQMENIEKCWEELDCSIFFINTDEDWLFSSSILHLFVLKTTKPQNHKTTKPQVDKIATLMVWHGMYGMVWYGMVLSYETTWLKKVENTQLLLKNIHFLKISTFLSSF